LLILFSSEAKHFLTTSLLEASATDKVIFLYHVWIEH
jgi:hypothetical protein